jgi:hypothetical protein
MSTLKLKGSTSGYVELTAPSTAGDNTITLPTTAGTAVIRDASNNTEVGTGVVIGSPASNTFTVTTNSTERLRITSAGFMGLGTSSPGDVLDTAAGNYRGITIKCATTAHLPTLSFFNTADSLAAYIQASGNNLVFGSMITDYGGHSPRMTLTSTGLGIGTVSPGTPLDVSGLIRANDSASDGYAGLVIATDSAARGYIGTAYLLNGGSETDIGYRVESGNNHIWMTGATERARIDSSGRLLVGTSSARATWAFSTDGSLQVERSNYAAMQVVGNANTTSGAYLSFLKSRGGAIGGTTIVQNNDELGWISFEGMDGANPKAGAAIVAFVDGTPGTNDMPGRLVFSTTADGASSSTERMRITNTGTVLVARTTNTSISPGAGLQPSSLAIEVGGDSTGSWWNRTDSNAAWVAQRFYAQGSQSGFIQVNTSSVTYATTSDYRLKENVVPLIDATNRVNQLQVHRFNFIADPDTTVDGFIAHEVQTIVPEAITGEKDAVDDEGNPEYQGIDQSKLVPLLTAALQEAIGEIESLKARLTAAGI